MAELTVTAEDDAENTSEFDVTAQIDIPMAVECVENGTSSTSCSVGYCGKKRSDRSRRERKRIVRLSFSFVFSSEISPSPEPV